MSWNSSDNKRYRGKIDRIYVSLTEYYEVDYFIHQYLKKRGADLSDSNRDVVGSHMDSFPWTGQSSVDTQSPLCA